MYLDVKQASAHINIKSKTLYSLAAKKQIPHYRIGTMLRFKAEELEAWMQEKKVFEFELIEKEEENKKIIDTVLKKVYNPIPKKAARPSSERGKNHVV